MRLHFPVGLSGCCILMQVAVPNPVHAAQDLQPDNPIRALAATYADILAAVEWSAPPDPPRTTGQAEGRAASPGVGRLVLGGLATILPGTVLPPGGGGGGKVVQKPPPQAEPPPRPPVAAPLPRRDVQDYLTNEHRAQHGLGLIRAADAYARGYTGAGVKVAVIDSGIAATHPDLAGAVAPGGRNVLDGTAEVGDRIGHGTHVAGIIAARRNSNGVHGVAFGAQVIPFKILAEDHTVTPGERYVNVGDAWRRGADAGARVFNNSWASNRYAGDIPRELVEFAAGGILESGRYVANLDGAIVFAAGNDRQANPAWEAGLPVVIPELAGHWVAVVAVDRNRQIWEGSNRCGDAKAFCLAAPGVAIPSTFHDGGMRTLTGTSLAAPHVSGAVAILMQLFPELTTPEILRILKETAQDLGAPGVDEIYGWGLVDLERATRPVGPLVFAAGPDAAAGGARVDHSGVLAGGALGDALAATLAGRTAAALDGYGRVYRVDLGAFAGRAMDAGPGLHERLTRFGRAPARTGEGGGMAFSFRPGPSGGVDTREVRLGLGGAFVEAQVRPDHGLGFAPGFAPGMDWPVGNPLANAHLAMIEGGFALAVGDGRTRGISWRASYATGSVPIADPERSQASSYAFGLSFGGQGVTFGLSAGFVREDGSLLGGIGQGAFAVADATTSFVGAHMALDLGAGFELAAGASIGLTRFSPAAGSVLSGGSGLVTSAFGVGVGKLGVFGDRDRFSFAISQPLRLEGGEFHFDIPIGRDRSGRVQRGRFQGDAAPSGRQIDLTATYARPLRPGMDLRLGFTHSLDAGHVRAGRPESLAMATLRIEF